MYTCVHFMCIHLVAHEVTPSWLSCCAIHQALRICTHCYTLFCILQVFSHPHIKQQVEGYLTVKTIVNYQLDCTINAFCVYIPGAVGSSTSFIFNCFTNWASIFLNNLDLFGGIQLFVGISCISGSAFEI